MYKHGFDHPLVVHFPDFIDHIFIDTILHGIDDDMQLLIWSLLFVDGLSDCYQDLEMNSYMRRPWAVRAPGLLFAKRAVGFATSPSRQRYAFRQLTAGAVQNLISIPENIENVRECFPRDDDGFASIELDFPWNARRNSDENEDYNSTLIIYMMHMMDKPAVLLKFFDCILDMIIDEEIAIPTDTKGKASLMFLLRMVSSADAKYMRGL